jgi:hypothetical protein
VIRIKVHQRKLTMLVIVRSCNGEPEGRGKRVRELCLLLDNNFFFSNMRVSEAILSFYVPNLTTAVIEIRE